MAEISYEAVVQSGVTVLAYETDTRRAKKLRMYLSNITHKAFISGEKDFIELYKRHDVDVVLFSFSQASDMQLLEQMYALNSDQITAVLIDDATAEEYKKFIEMDVKKFILKPYDAKQLLQDTLLLAQGKIIYHKSLQLSEQKAQEAKKIDHLKDSLLTLFTHELKTPLNAILNFSKHSYKLVNKSEIAHKEKVLYELREIANNSRVIADLVDNIINSMKIRAGNINIKKEKINLLEFFTTIQELYIEESQGVDVELQIASALHIVSDREYLKQLFVNLYTNALKYGEGQVAIFATIEADRFEISVEDNGAGLADDEQLFELFGQSSSDMMQRTDVGVGVGLYLVKEIVDILGYNIRVDKSSTLGGAKISIEGDVGL